MEKALEEKIRDLIKQHEEERRLGDKRAEQFYNAIKTAPDFSLLTEPSPVVIVGADFLIYQDVTDGLNYKINLSDIPHDLLAGLSDDDHTQYHNDARGDARYYTEAEMNLAMDMNKRVTIPRNIFRVYLNTQMNNLTDGTWTTILYDVENYDRNNAFASYTLTAGYAGYFDIGARALLSGLLDVTSGQLQIRFLKNGSTVISRAVIDTEYSTASRVWSLQLHDQVYLAVNDTVVVQVKNNYGGSNQMDVLAGEDVTVFYGRLAAF